MTVTFAAEKGDCWVGFAHIIADKVYTSLLKLLDWFSYDHKIMMEEEELYM